MSLARIKTLASFTYPGGNPAFVSIDEMSGDNFTVHVRDHANRMGVSGRQVSVTMDGESFRAFVRDLYANAQPQGDAKP